MKRIISSVGTVSFAAAVLLVGATGAFFSDTEASTGNVFTAGSFDFEVDSFDAVLNGVSIPGTNWSAQDLTSQKFFYFSEVMPGDRGVRHLSLHNNSDVAAYACFLKGAETTNTNDMGKEIEAVAWKEASPNLRYNPANETLLSGVVSIEDLDNIVYADSASGTPVASLGTDHIAIAWCAGDLTVNPAGNPGLYPGESGSTIECDGAGMVSQGGSYVADMIVYGEQSANNPSFLCSNV